jgi:DNA-binding response OmpR family regulator
METRRERPATAGKQILLVEDHEDSAEMMTIFLESEGYTVRWVNNAADALRIFDADAAGSGAAVVATDASTARPDLILLDLTLPDIDGIEVGRRLRQTAPQTPIIIMSAKSVQAVESAAQSIHAVGYVRKPFDTGKLMAGIASALAGREAKVGEASAAAPGSPD